MNGSISRVKLDRVEFEAGTSRPTTSFVTVFCSLAYPDDDEMIRKRCGVMVVTVNKDKKRANRTLLPNLCWLWLLRLSELNKSTSLAPTSLSAIIQICMPCPHLLLTTVSIMYTGNGTIMAWVFGLPLASPHSLLA